MRVASLLSIIAGACALPAPLGFIHDSVAKVHDSMTKMQHALFGDALQCTGSADIPADLPRCYTGSAKVLGGAFTEDVTVQLKTYKNSAGTIDIHADGASTEDCHDLPFKKAGQNLSFDASCLSLGEKGVSAKYCSDQDAVLLHVTLPALPAVEAVLHKKAC